MDFDFWREYDLLQERQDALAQRARESEFFTTLDWTTEQSLKFNRIILDIEMRLDAVLERRK